MDNLLIILASLLMTGSVVFCFIPRGWSAVCAFAGMVLMWCTDHTMLAVSQLWFWGAAAFIVLAIAVLLPLPVVRSRQGVAYVVVGTVAGLLVGLLVSPAVMVLGGALGAVCGAMAFSRTPMGAKLDFPSRHFVNYLCAKALPPVITLSIVAVTLLSFFTAGNQYLM